MPKIQAIIFKINKWTPATALAWLKRHGHQPIKRVDKTPNYLRYRLIPQENFKKYFMKEITRAFRPVLSLCD